MKSSEAAELARDLQLLHSSPEQVRFHGWSMVPILQEGDQVLLEPVALEEIRVGDIITYRYRDKYPTRRVVRREGDRLFLWCDNWPKLRFTAEASDLLGRVTGRIRDGNRLNATDVAWERQTTAALRLWRGPFLMSLLHSFKRAVKRRLSDPETRPGKRRPRAR